MRMIPRLRALALAGLLGLALSPAVQGTSSVAAQTLDEKSDLSGPEDEQTRRELPAAPESGPPLPPRRTAWERLTRPPGFETPDGDR